MSSSKRFLGSFLTMEPDSDIVVMDVSTEEIETPAVSHPLKISILLEAITFVFGFPIPESEVPQVLSKHLINFKEGYLEFEMDQISEDGRTLIEILQKQHHYLLVNQAGEMIKIGKS